MDEVLYRKKGKRYVPVSHVDVWDYREAGAYLTIIKPGSRSITTVQDIEAAGVHAAMKCAMDAMIDAMSNASMLQPTTQTSPITLEQRDLLDKLEATGFNASWWRRNSLRDIVEAGVKELKAIMDSDDK
jgi:aspartate aminotransferase-like enzyme